VRWGIGVAAGGRLWLALGIESHRVYWASRTALLRPSGGSIEAWWLIEERARERECGAGARPRERWERRRARGAPPPPRKSPHPGSAEETKVAQCGFHPVS